MCKSCRDTGLTATTMNPEDTDTEYCTCKIGQDLEKMDDMQQADMQDKLNEVYVNGATELAGSTEEDFAAYKTRPQVGDPSIPH